MATAPPKIAKAITQEEKEFKDQLETSIIPSNNLNAPKHGTVIPNRVFVGGISSATTESDLMALFSNYGTVTGAKIIADRAGVSKGYGFVTFETEEEAKRLQKDADNIMLRERRLNIAPAIKKQGYGRAAAYECPATPVPMPAQVYRQNGGVPFTFHNGMAFFPQPTHQTMASAHIDTPTVYQQGAHYVSQGSPAPAYQYPYAQGQVIYQAAPQYPYQMPYEGCYESGLMMHEANLVVPPYYLAPPEGITYYQPAPMHPQDLNPHLPHPIMFPSPQRTFDSSIVYPPEPSTDSETSQVQIQEADTSAANTVTTTSANLQAANQEITTTSSSNETNLRRGGGKDVTPVVSLLKLNNQKEVNSNGKAYYHQNNYHSQPTYQMRRKPRYDEARRGPHLNNNTPETANRNLIHYQQHQQQGGPPRGNRRGSGASGDDSSHYSTTTPTPRPGVPSYPYYPRQAFTHPPPSNSQHPFYHQPPPPHRSRQFFNRPRFGGGAGRGGGGRGGYHSQQQRSGTSVEGFGKYGKEEEGGSSQPLTPPITPKSDSGRATTPASQQQQTEELVKSIQAVAI